MISDLPKDVIIYLALTMDLPEILGLCRTNSRFNDLVCENDTFWRNKLSQDYKIYQVPKSYLSYKEYYKFLTNELKNPFDALYIGSNVGDINLVRLALEKGVDVHIWDDLAVRIASKYGHLDIVRYLVEKGANYHVRDDQSLNWATISGHDDVVKYLKSLP